MLFSSLTFLFLFLPFAIIFYYLIDPKKRNIFLLLMSLFFYFWGTPYYAWLLLLSVLANYIFVLLISKYRKQKLSQYIFILAIIYNLGILSVFKYANFVIDNANQLLPYLYLGALPVLNIGLPLGISFYTFHMLSYVIDVFTGKSKPQRNPFNLALYLSFFPQLIAGPIIRYHDFAPQFYQRKVAAEDFYYGIKRFIIGLAKKVIIANGVGQVVDQVFSLPPSDLTTPLAWFAILCYTLQIYYDFSGYIDMAIGLGRMFGFRLPENFNFPYMAKSIQDFWRRWNITLSTWFRDYLYIPLGGSRKGKYITYRNILIVFTLVGVWHGASWNFFLWGVYNAALLVIERAGFQKIIYSLWFPVKHLYALLAIVLGWVIFRSESLSYIGIYLKRLFIFANDSQAPLTVGMLATSEVILVIALGLLFSVPINSYLKQLLKALFSFSPLVQKRLSVAPLFIEVVVLFFLILYAAMLLANSTYNPFIYFRF